MEVEVPAVERRMVDLEVAGVDDGPDRRVNRQRDGVRDAVRDADELDDQRPDFHARGRLDDAKAIAGVNLVFFQLRLDKRERERGAVDRSVNQWPHVWHAADVVLVPMRQHERRDAARLQIGQIRHDEIDAGQLGARKHRSGVDDEGRLTP